MVIQITANKTLLIFKMNIIVKIKECALHVHQLKAHVDELRSF